MYCSRRDCWEDVYVDDNNEFQQCKKHYDDTEDTKKNIKFHTPENCFCGKDHSKVSEK